MVGWGWPWSAYKNKILLSKRGCFIWQDIEIGKSGFEIQGNLQQSGKMRVALK